MNGEFRFSTNELYSFELIHKPNQHTSVHFTKLLTALDLILASVQLGAQMTVFTPSNRILFTGMVQNVRINENESHRFLEVEGVSNTILLDMSRKCRVFQDVTAQYQTVLAKVDQELKEDTALAAVSSTLKSPTHSFLVPDKPLSELLVQYQETDWEFLMRVASHFEQLVFADTTSPGCKYLIGIPPGKGLVIPHLERHDIHQEIDMLQHQLPETYDGSEKFHQMRSAYRLIFESDLPVAIGDRIEINGQALLVREYRTFLDENVLSHDICCVKEESFYTPKQGNQNLCGHSLRAVVKEVKHDTVSVQFVEIEKEAPSKMHPFVYATPYSAGESTGFYFMPEIEDTVLVKFPTQREEDAFSDGSIRVNGEGEKAQTGDPSVKYIRTAAGKEIALSETYIKISMKDKDGNDMHILIDDENGIEIKTDLPIQLHSEKEISLSAKSNIELKADEVKLSGKSSEITLSSTMELKGDIKMG